MKNIFVGNLDFNTNEDDLRQTGTTKRHLVLELHAEVLWFGACGEQSIAMV
jgi:hypothetical protein